MIKKLLVIFIIFPFILISCLSDKTPPEVNYIQHNAVISPNGDGVQDELIFDINIKDTADVKYWKLEIFNDKKEMVKIFTSGGTLEEAKQKLFFKKGNVEIPPQIRWDGKDNSGKLLPDGKYTFRFIAMDGEKNVTPDNMIIGTVIIKTDKPEVKAKIDDKLFSPNNDNNKDILYIDIDIIKAKVDNKVLDKDFKQIWTVDIINEKGEVVRSYQYTEKGQYKIGWDGKDNQGNKVPDGKYQVKIYSTDNGGNYWEKIITNITVDTKATPVKVNASAEYFSPNGDNVKDSITLSYEIPVSEGLLNWTMDILNSKGDVVKSYNGTGMPKPITWNGKDESNNLCPEDSYKAVLKAVYANGNNPSNESKAFILDNTLPNATVSISSDVFSPDGNGIQDELIILQNTSKENEEWKGVILNDKGQEIKTFIWQGQPPKKIEWDGKDNDNKLVKDGTYYYQLSSIDSAGNTYKSEKFRTRVYTAETPIVITASYNTFSPNNDKIFDSQLFEIRFTPTKENEVSDWKLVINDNMDKPVYTIAKTEDLPKVIEWNGITSANKYVTGGTYYASLIVNFKAGTTTTVKSKSFAVDLDPPTVKLTTSPKYFSPDEDGVDDELKIQMQADDVSGVKNWSIIIYDPFTQAEFISFKGDGNPPESITWDGKSSAGELVESVEDYPVKITAEDNIGNKIEKQVDPIMIDILVIKLPDGRLKVRVSNIKFKPDSPEMTNIQKNKDVLDLLAKALNKYQKYNITIEGYANKFREGLDEKAAKDLALKRAQTVAKELSKRGIKTDRMKIVGLGFDNPIVPLKPNMTKEEIQSMEKNRRVEFYLQ